MSKKPRRSPRAGVLIERDVDGKSELVTAYAGSSLKGGRAFAQALRSAQADQQARRVLYMELVKAQPVVLVSVPIQHETKPYPSAADLF